MFRYFMLVLASVILFEYNNKNGPFPDGRNLFLKQKSLCTVVCLEFRPIPIRAFRRIKVYQGLTVESRLDRHSRMALNDNGGSLCVHWPTDDPASATEP